MAGEAPSRIERVLVRDRWVIGVFLGLLVALAWIYLVVRAREMAAMSPSAAMPDMPGMPGMGAALEPFAAEWSVRAFGLTVAMWWIMMIGMMVPSATPIVLLFGGVQRRQLAEEGPAMRVAVFVLGYLVVWGLFSVVAAMAQMTLAASDTLTMQLSLPASVGAAVVALAGIYQLTPLKAVCLRHCRSPAELLSRHWHPGTSGAFRMGLHHGAYCVGCCWLLMALLFVFGVMNLLWVALFAGVVLAEKLVVRGDLFARASGVLLLLLAGYLLLGS